jgi:hypothetical protein
MPLQPVLSLPRRLLFLQRFPTPEPVVACGLAIEPPTNDRRSGITSPSEMQRAQTHVGNFVLSTLTNHVGKNRAKLSQDLSAFSWQYYPIVGYAENASQAS